MLSEVVTVLASDTAERSMLAMLPKRQEVPVFTQLQRWPWRPSEGPGKNTSSKQTLLIR